MIESILVLGCRGREEAGVVLCGGTSFTLFDTRLAAPDDFELQNYLYRICKVHLNPITDQNGVVNLIQFLSTGYIPHPKIGPIQEWVKLHKRCGMYVYRTDP